MMWTLSDILLITSLIIAAPVSTAFGPTHNILSVRTNSRNARPTSFAPMEIAGYASCHIKTRICRMATDAEEREEAAAAAAASVKEMMASVKSGETAVYDDESEPPKEENVSSAMKDKLMREAAAGLDSEKSQNNVILYISAVVAVLVLAGGRGIFYDM